MQNSVRRFTALEKVRITEQQRTKMEIEQAVNDAKIKKVHDSIPDIRKKARADTLADALDMESNLSSKTKAKLQAE